MRFSNASAVRNDLLQLIADFTKSPHTLPNVSDVSMDYDNIVAPHASTSRVSYTVPANRIALIQNTNIHMGRDTAPTIDAQAGATVKITFAIAGSANVAKLRGKVTPIGETINNSIWQNYALYEGDRVDLLTFDLSTGGLMTYSITANILEFDPSA